MTDTDRTAFGIPIVGKIDYSARGNIAQRPFSELVPIVKDVFADTSVYDFGWHQYTPYFDDGDLCVFKASGFWARTTNDVLNDRREAESCGAFIDDDNENMNIGEYAFDMDERYSLDRDHPSLGVMDRPRTYDRVTQTYTYGEVTYTGVDRERYERVERLAFAIEDGSFFDALVRKFGESTRVRVTREKIYLQGYDHY